MEQTRICPWCQTEIVPDPELGLEEVCPNCMNELSDYRTISLDYDIEEENQPAGHDELEDEFERRQSLERGVGKRLEVQDETMLCHTCEEDMLFAGERVVSSDQFYPDKQMPTPILIAPFRQEMFVCPWCARVAYRLGENERMALSDQLLQEGKKRTK